MGSDTQVVRTMDVHVTKEMSHKQEGRCDHTLQLGRVECIW
jgi:hypothetical protein